MESVSGLVIALCVFTSGLAFGQSNLVIDSDEYYYVATFDPGRISAARLRELLLFSPYDFGLYGWKVDHQEVSIGYNETPGRLEKSAIAHPLDCVLIPTRGTVRAASGTYRTRTSSQNAEVNTGRNAKALAALNRLNAPTELGSIVQQFRESLSFYSTIERRRLEYLRTGDLRLLSTPIGTIDPSTQCTKEIRELNGVTTLRRRYEFSRYVWHDCLNSTWRRVGPAYPQEAWRIFLRDYGIIEQFTSKPID